MYNYKAPSLIISFITFNTYNSATTASRLHNNNCSVCNNLGYVNSMLHKHRSYEIIVALLFQLCQPSWQSHA